MTRTGRGNSLKTAGTIDVPEQAAGIDFWKTEAPPPVALLVRGRYRFRGIALRQGKAHNFACGSGKQWAQMYSRFPHGWVLLKMHTLSPLFAVFRFGLLVALKQLPSRIRGVGGEDRKCENYLRFWQFGDCQSALQR
jgi:hypothetical protein